MNRIPLLQQLNTLVGNTGATLGTRYFFMLTYGVRPNI
jgi:hypothetical protein